MDFVIAWLLFMTCVLLAMIGTRIDKILDVLREIRGRFK